MKKSPASTPLIIVGGLVVLALLVGLIVVLKSPGLSPLMARIDATDEKTFQDSIFRVRQSLSESDEKEFEMAVRAIIGEKLFSGGLLAGAVDLNASVRSKLHGKTGPEVIAMGKQARAKVAAKRKEIQDSFDKAQQRLDAELEQ